MLANRDQAIAALGNAVECVGDVDAFCQALSVSHPSILRRRSEVPDSELPVPTAAIDWYPLGRRSLNLGQRPSATLSYGVSDFFLQDAGSLLALAACEASTRRDHPMLICDLCAAPGAKASALLESIGEGFLLANEPIRARVAPLAYNLARTGIPRYAVSSMDPDELANQLGGVFDMVLVDAPCSGQALMGRGRQSQAAMSAQQIDHSAARQRRILDAALRCLRADGKLVYSTCTFAEAENESQISRLVEAGMARHAPQPTLDAYESFLPGTYRLWPHRHDCAGSFAAAIVNQTDNPPRLKRNKSKKADRSPVDLSQWYDDVSTMRVQSGGSVIWGWPDGSPEWVSRVAIAGPELAHRTGQTWKPSHAGGLRRDVAAIARETIELDAETACQFLGGSPIPCPLPGWQVVRHDGKPLGWVKASRGNREACIGKNQLPASARMSVSPLASE